MSVLTPIMRVILKPPNPASLKFGAGPTTEYIFILHDVDLPYTLLDTIRFFHDDVNPPSNINFGIIENSSCNASGLEYVVDIYIKDLTFPAPFSDSIGFLIGGTEDFTLNGKPDASFDYEEIDCGVFTFTNTSTSGEFVNNSFYLMCICNL